MGDSILGNMPLPGFFRLPPHAIDVVKFVILKAL
jgi:hypothetical protein